MKLIVAYYNGIYVNQYILKLLIMLNIIQ